MAKSKIATLVSPSAPQYIAARIERLRSLLAKQKLPGLLITSYQDVSYLTGFEGDDSYLVITPERAILISDSRYEEQISREAPWLSSHMRTKGILLETAKILHKLKLPKCGVQAETMTLSQLQGLKDHLSSPIKFIPVSDLIVNLRHIKDEHEILIIEKSIQIAEEAFVALRSYISENLGNISENEVASLLVHEMRKRGASGPSFDTIVGTGPNGSLPHYRPGSVLVQDDCGLLIDWGARYQGYCSDLTRVLFIGSIPPPMGKVYQIVLEAQKAAIAAIKPGKHGKDIDKIARDIITKAGYGACFGHGLGHGFGRDIHEPIALSKLSKTVLQPGMVITVEPGIYLPGVGGVRIEDDILVTPQGFRVLSKLPKDLSWAQL